MDCAGQGMRPVAEIHARPRARFQEFLVTLNFFPASVWASIRLVLILMMVRHSHSHVAPQPVRVPQTLPGEAWTHHGE